MRAPARLAAFAASLVLVFGAAFALGAALGPEPDDAPAPAGTTEPAATDDDHSVGEHGRAP